MTFIAAPSTISDPRGPFTPGIPMPIVLFPEDLQARASKLPMPDADREMLVMRIEQRRDYLRKMGRLLAAGKDEDTVVDECTGAQVNVGALRARITKESLDVFWQEQLVMRSDILLAMERAR